jgi:serine/threonine-protein kinase PpkA
VERATAATPVRNGERLAAWEKAEIGGYRIGRQIGEGRAAYVYLAHGVQGRPVALKVIKRHGPDTALARQHFPSECRTLAAAQHEHVVRLIDYAASDDTAYLAMEYLEGGTLRDVMRAGITPARALSLLRQAGQGLAALHARAIVHRDVKPENYLFRAGGALVLADFGLAGYAGSASTRAAIGSPGYASPQQVDGGAPAPAWDIYSLGVVFFEMLCGHRPFPGETLLEIRAQHLMAPIPTLDPRLARYQPLVDGMLEKQMERRIVDGSALLNEIERVERATPQATSSFYRVAQPLSC